MRHILFFFSLVLSFWIAPIVMADQMPYCSQPAIEEANNQYLQKISNHISEFSNSNNHAAVEELNKIKPKESFQKKHAKEIKQFNDNNYQPSQEFCNDAYNNLKELDQQVIETIKKHKADEKTTT